MRLAILPEDARQTGDAALVRIGAGDRARVSGPGLRAFRAIADRWALSEKQRLTLLGEPARSTYHQWMKKAQARAPLTLPLDTLLRISAVLGVHKALSILFVHDGEAMTWLKGPHEALVFAHQSPLEVMLSGTQDGILTVRRYLDGWRGGLHGGPAPDSGVAPVRAEDLVFI